VVPEGDRISAGGEHLVRKFRRDSDSVGEVLAVQDADVGVQLLTQRRKALLDGAPAGDADDVCDEEDPQGRRFAAARSSIETWLPASCV
jgi:hypothetical protein